MNGTATCHLTGCEDAPVNCQAIGRLAAFMNLQPNRPFILHPYCCFD